MIQTKYFLIILLTAFQITQVSCQEREVPKAVSESFIAQYPGEDDPDWEMDAHGNWESHFKIEGIKYRADYRPDGTWVETETSIDEDDLPKPIKKAIKADYKHEDITEVEFVQSATLGEFYDVEFKRKGKNKDVMFRADGSIVKI